MSESSEITPEEVAATGATGVANTPSNIIPMPTTPDVPLASSQDEVNLQSASAVGDQSAAAQTELPPATDANTVDLSKVTFDEVFADVVQKTKEFAFRLIVSCGLLEQIALRDGFANAPATSESTTEAPVATETTASSDITPSTISEPTETVVS
jgi:hypothetical protein